MTFLDGPWAKVSRGNEHLKDFYTAINALGRHGNILKSEIHTNEEPKPVSCRDRRLWIRFGLHAKEVPTARSETGILVGEILHQYRGALDHLAWLLVGRGNTKRLDSAQRKRVAFPMAENRGSFWRGVSNKLPGVSQDYRTLIERYQPYRRSDYGRAMKYLRNLSDIDKHRIILPVAILPSKVKLRIEFEGGDPVGPEVWMKSGKQLKEGTEIVRIILAATRENPKVNMKGTIGLTYGLPPAVARPHPPFTALGLGFILESIKNTCTEILSQFEVRH